MDLNYRSADPGDFKNITELLNKVMLPVEGVKENLNHFIILENDKQLLAVAGYEIYGDKALLRSVAVEKNCQGKGFGKRLVENIISMIKKKNLSEIYLLTETAPSFFKSFGFTEVSREKVDNGIKSSAEFRSICPSTALCMKMDLSVNYNLSE